MTRAVLRLAPTFLVTVARRNQEFRLLILINVS
jgi:hypothetical protein